MKGLNLITALLLDLSIPGANDVQNILPREFIFVSRPPLPPMLRCAREDATVPAGCVVAGRPVAARRRQRLKVLELCCVISKQHTACGNMRLRARTEDASLISVIDLLINTGGRRAHKTGAD